jgi:solute carrier family 5 (sodium-coupled monocarboxylate transporter), member 8/12
MLLSHFQFFFFTPRFAVSGIDIHAITPITCVCCIFYTCVGGIKAVIYTDVVQSLMMFGAMFLVIIKGTLDVGGLGLVIDRNIDSGRIEPPEYVNCY